MDKDEAFEAWAAGEIRLRPARHIRKDVARDAFKAGVAYKEAQDLACVEEVAKELADGQGNTPLTCRIIAARIKGGQTNQGDETRK